MRASVHRPLAATAAVVVCLLLPQFAMAASESRLSDEPIPYKPELAPERPQPIELGPPFLGTGKIERGIEIPGGAVWQPQLLITSTRLWQALDKITPQLESILRQRCLLETR